MIGGFGKSLTARLTLLFAAVSSAVLLILGLVIGELVERHFEDMDRDLLEGNLELVQYALAAAQASGDFQGLPAQLDAALVGQHGLAVGIWAADGRPLFLSHAAAFPAASLPLGSHADLPKLWQDSNGQRYRGIAGEAFAGLAGAAPLKVWLATSLAHHDRFMQSFRLALWSVVSLAALLSGFLGWIVARRGLAPLRHIARRAAAITASRLDQRIESAGIPAELGEVVNTLNAMLGRLQESFERLSGFSSDIAHELRTPVSNLLTQTQVMLAKPRSLEAYQDVLASNAEELERLSRTIADMLFLAKADNRLLVPNQEQVDLHSETASLLEFYEVLAEERHLQLRLHGDAMVNGDRLMLRRALSNLLSNAIRHTPDHGYVAITLQSAPGSVRVRVENSGDTIPAEHLPRLFDRFYRADASRHHAGEGSGLGLAIAQSIAAAHHGEISVESGQGVTAFTLKLPVEGL